MNEYESGLGTSTMMWEMLGNELEENEIGLPTSLSDAIVALSNGEAAVARKPSDSIIDIGSIESTQNSDGCFVRTSSGKPDLLVFRKGGVETTVELSTVNTVISMANLHG